MTKRFTYIELGDRDEIKDYIIDNHPQKNSYKYKEYHFDNISDFEDLYDKLNTLSEENERLKSKIKRVKHEKSHWCFICDCLHQIMDEEAEEGDEEIYLKIITEKLKTLTEENENLKERNKNLRKRIKVLENVNENFLWIDRKIETWTHTDNEYCRKYDCANCPCRDGNLCKYGDIND